APKQDWEPEFLEGERALCFHGPLLNEAKCAKVAIKDKQVKYFIHYSGWNFEKVWNERAPESRALKYVGTRLQRQRELQKANGQQRAEGKMRGAAPGKKTSGLQQNNAAKNQQKTPGSGDGGRTSETPQPPWKKRARADPTAENEETLMSRVEVTLFYLPAKNSILEDYASNKKSRGNTDNKEYAVNELVAGVKEYFSVMLDTQLLYKFERPQYAEILADHPDAPMSRVDGAPHLLRLFAQIGAMLAYTPLDGKSLALLLNYLHDFLKYLARNSATLFSARDYEVAPPAYHRKAV
uniref:Mortality factor 4-like protein 1 n=1 Tax=Jaculus jaculus TaxID=51337 RepID=A0A8C5L1F6_JACJA